MLLPTNQLKLHLGVGFGEEMRLMPNSISRLRKLFHSLQCIIDYALPLVSN